MLLLLWVDEETLFDGAKRGKKKERKGEKEKGEGEKEKLVIDHCTPTPPLTTSSRPPVHTPGEAASLLLIPKNHDR